MAPPWRRKTLEHGMTLQFGKHVAELIEDVIEDDPGWVRWAYDEDLIDLDDELEELLAERESGRDRR